MSIASTAQRKWATNSTDSSTAQVPRRHHCLGITANTAQTLPKESGDDRHGGALHLAGGVVIAVIGPEPMPRALEADPAWVSLIAFVVGGGLFLGVDALSGFLRARGWAVARVGPWASMWVSGWVCSATGS
ncbi:hypothetical protein GCM10009602_09270 [Nocardiopsis tropica]